jgi:uncharacterized membrane protein
LHPTYMTLSIGLTWLSALLLSGLASSTVMKLSARFPRALGKILVLVLLMVLFSGSLLSVYSARVLNRSPNESRVVEEVRGYSFEEVTLGKWLVKHSPSNASILADTGSYVLISGIYSLELVEFWSWNDRASLLLSSDFFLESEYYLTCVSFYPGKDTSPVLVETSSFVNRLWDGGMWRLLTARLLP